MLAQQTDIFQVKGTKAQLWLHPGQTAAWDSSARFPFIIAGTQSGKTSFGPWWLWREMEQKGPGDYLAVTATFDLFKLKMLPEIKRVFRYLYPDWTYHAYDRVYFSPKEDYRLILRSADSDGGLESSTAKAAWLDECGQDRFTISAWEAVQRRLSLERGRVLGTTTPYNLGWLKSEVYDRWTAGDPDYQVIQFSSTMNPLFPPEEFERMERILPRWKFMMFYKGLFDRPAGMIYDCFEERHKIKSFRIPDSWEIYGGLDFGGVHTAAVRIARNPSNGYMVVTDEYLEGGRTAKEHWERLQKWNCQTWVGGSWSEENWRAEFRQAGMNIGAPKIKEVEVGITRVYGAHKRNKLNVFDDCSHYLDEKGRYARKLNKAGEVTEEIQDKNTFHLMDAERYIIGWLEGDTWLMA